MSVIRCPQCNVPLTTNEARTGICPDCKAPLPRQEMESVRGYPARESSSGGGREFSTPYRRFGGGKPLASLGARFLAYLVDGVIGLIACLPGLILMVVGIVQMVDQQQKMEMEERRHRAEQFQQGGAPMPPRRVEVDPTLYLMGFGLLMAGSFLLAIIQIVLLSMSGQTIGKKFMKIRIVGYEDDQTAGFLKAVLLRAFINGLIAGVVPFYGLIDVCFIFGEERRCIHDLIAGTKVVEV